MIIEYYETKFFRGGGSGHQLFLVMLNLRSKFFCLQSTLDSEFFRGDVQGPTFLGHTKFEVKNFLEFFQLHSTVDSELLMEGTLGTNFFGSC